MARPFREHHLFNLLNGYEGQNSPLDYWISKYFKANTSLGPKDRGMITETIYGMVRWRGLLDHLSNGTPSWEKRFETYQKFDPNLYLGDDSIPEHVKLSFPKPLYQLIVKDYGEAGARELCLASNTPAPTTVRSNILKTTREALIERWNEYYEVSPGVFSPYAIHFAKKTAFFSMPEFKEGLFEVQDEGSQLVADLVDAGPNDQVMDYCSGSGGKTLAFAHKMRHRGQIYLHDIRPWILDESRKRLKRAGIQNAQAVLPDSPKLDKLAGKMDWVLVDAPCTGTGTLRRNPDMKWKFETASLDRLVVQQREIFEKSLRLLKPGGKIVYATCSLFFDENQRQADYFCEKHGLERVRQDLHILPSVGGMDGFYGATLRAC